MLLQKGDEKCCKIIRQFFSNYQQRMNLNPIQTESGVLDESEIMKNSILSYNNTHRQEKQE